uniref:Uncharacterized protein n=1 Tax=Anguilla anguilla TaxID=7936 RepID=A0A0E9VH85_ANGAN
MMHWFPFRGTFWFTGSSLEIRKTTLRRREW